MDAPNRTARGLALAAEAIRHGCFLRFELDDVTDFSDLHGEAVQIKELKPLHEVIEKLRSTLRRWDLRPADRCVIRGGQVLLPVYSARWLDITLGGSRAAPIPPQEWAEVRRRLIEHWRSMKLRKQALEATAAGCRKPDPAGETAETPRESPDNDHAPEGGDAKDTGDAGMSEETIETAQLAQGQDHAFRAMQKFRGQGGAVAVPADGPGGFETLTPPDAVHINAARVTESGTNRISGQVTGIELTYNAVIVDSKWIVEYPRCSAMSPAEQIELIGKPFDRLVKGRGHVLSLSLYTAEQDLFEEVDAERD